MLDREWSIEPDEVFFNSKNKLEAQRTRKILKTAAIFNAEAQNSGLVSRRDKGKSEQKIKIP